MRLCEGEGFTGGGIYCTAGLVHEEKVITITIISCICNEIEYCKLKIIMLYMLIPIMTVTADMNI